MPNKTIGEMTDRELDELLTEIAEERENRKRKVFTALPREEMCFADVIEQAVHMHEAEMTNGDCYDDDDNKQYLYEAVMEAIYGKDYFKRLRESTAQG